MTWAVAGSLLLKFCGFYFLEVVFGYLLPAGWFHYRYHRGNLAQQDARRIQDKVPGGDQIWREVLASLRTFLIFAIGSVALYEAVVAGWTKMYWPLTARPLWYVPVSFILCALLLDAYFYWVHRFMHWRPVFALVHLTHHRSVTPTPWTIFAFSPLEAVLQFLPIALLVFLVPMCPLVLVLVLSHNTLVNVAGHNGIEIIPKSISQAPILRWFNTVTHHDAHHSNTRVNYGSYFNLWDRWMGTFAEKHTRAVLGTRAPAKARESGGKSSGPWPRVHES